MSLINQMLKDLESRRRPAGDAGGIIAGMSGRHPGSSRRGLLTVLGLVIVLLASLLGYLLWQKAQNSAATPQEAQAPTTQQATPAPAPQPGVASAAPATPAPSPEPAPPVEEPAPLVEKHAPEPSPEKTVTAGTAPEITAKQSVSKPSQAEQEEPEPYLGAPIEKRIRPLRPAQIAEQRYQRGYSQLQRGDKQGAETLWKEALQADPTHTSSREALAALYLSQGRRVEAAEQLQQGLEYQPGYGQFALLYARLQLENGDAAGAIRIMERAIQEQAQSADFYAFLAAIYQREGDYQNSIGAYQRALNQRPSQSVWWMGIGISLEGAGKPTEALTAYEEALKNGGLSEKLRHYVEGRVSALK